jgi:hypothetical protein
VTCIVADFFFAAFPWVFIWNLNMKYKEKVTIAASLSLGIMYVPNSLLPSHPAPIAPNSR